MIDPYYQDSHVTIYHATWQEVLYEMQPGSVDCVMTSPPYNLVRNWIDSNGPNSIHKIWARKIQNDWYDDDLPEEEYQEQQRCVLEEAIRVCAGSVFYNHKVRHAVKRLGRVIDPMEWMGGLPLWGEIIWDRCGGMGHNSHRFVPSDERIYQFSRPKTWHQLGYTNIWRIPARPQELDHPCPFPLEIPLRCIAATTDPGDSVLDMYMGSGTTLLAARVLGRRAIGIERVEAFCELTARRLQDHDSTDLDRWTHEQSVLVEQTDEATP
jgi:site-specific DNA-methyltransferase (adenine-specific)